MKKKPTIKKKTGWSHIPILRSQYNYATSSLQGQLIYYIPCNPTPNSTLHNTSCTSYENSDNTSGGQTLAPASAFLKWSI